MKEFSDFKLWQYLTILLFLNGLVIKAQGSIELNGATNADNICFVDASATGNNDGTSWTDAYISLQDAITNSSAGDNIWVAKGTYHPTIEVDGTGDRSKAFRLKNGVPILGGFAGNEDPLSFDIGTRDFTTNETILSGDLNNDDDFDAANGGYQGTTGNDNCYHVINHPDPGAGSLSADNTAILDGFTIIGGNANGSAYADKEGGGMASHRGNPTLRNLIFKNNSAEQYGGGLRCYVSSSSVTNVKFIENVVTTYDGAGLFNTYCDGMVLTDLEFISNVAERSGAGMGCYYSSPTINSARFISNTATYGGGGLYCSNSSPTVNNALFYNNQCDEFGGAIQCHSSNLQLNNATIVNNSSNTYGGGISGSGSPVIRNSIIWGNSAVSRGNQMFIYNATFQLKNTCYENGTGDNEIYYTASYVFDENCITTDPSFIDAPNNDYRIYGTSPCANSGENTYNSTNTDIRDEARIQNTTIDMGAFEWTAGVDPYDPVYILATWTGASDTDWGTTSNWDIGTIPTLSHDVIIPDVSNNPEIGSMANIHKLTIDADAVLKVNQGGTLSIETTLANNAGTSGLVLKSDATGTGKLVNNSTGVQATVEQFITDDCWHYMGIPFTETPTALIAFKGLYVTMNDESTAVTGTESGWSYLSTTDLISAGKGYGIYHATGDTTVSVSGTLVAGNKVVNTTFGGEGWNFVANPYPCTVDWDALKITGLLNTDDAIYVWDPLANNYSTYIGGIKGGADTQDQYIAPMQGFFVKATAVGSVTFTDAAKTAEASSFKSVEMQSIVRLSVYDEMGRADAAVIRIHPSATEQFDGKLDAYKIVAGTSPTPQLYSILNGDEYSINSIPEISETTVIPLELMIKTTGQHTLALTEQNAFDYAYPVVLLNASNEVVAYLESEDYTFTAEAGETVQLFLAFSETVSVKAALQQNLFATGERQQIMIGRMDNMPSEVTVYNLSGQKVFYKQNVETYELTIPVNKQGVYMVRVQPENGSAFIGKVVVK